jgi:hypothetical protein
MEEPVAANEGVKAIMTIAGKPIQLESDYTVVIDELNASADSKTAISGIVEDTRRLLQNLMDLNCQIRKIWELCCS